MNLKEILQKGKKFNFKLYSYIALAVSVFFLVGAFIGIDENTQHVLPIIYGISIVAAIVFILFRILIVLQKKYSVEDQDTNNLENTINDSQEIIKSENNDKEKTKEISVEEYNQLLQDIEIEFNNVIYIVSTHGVKHFYEGIEKIKRDFSSYDGVIIDKCIYEITCKYISNDEKYVKLALAVSLLSACVKFKSKLMGNISNDAAWISLRAINFKRYNGSSPNEYTSITKDMCENFVVNNCYYKEKINEHPFDKEQYIEMYSKDIISKKCFLFNYVYHNSNGIFNFKRKEWLSNEEYYTDAICYFLCEDLAKEANVDELMDASDAYDLILNQINT